jgi:anti-sigma-K factor RskA
VSDRSLDDLARRLEELPREAWDRPVPPPAPWPAETPAPAARRRRLVLRPLGALAATVALLAVGVGGGLLLAGDDDAPVGTQVAPDRVELKPVAGRAQGAAGVVSLEPQAGGTATVKLSGLRPSKSGDFYELWLLGDGGELVSLGSVRVPASGRATLENVQLPVDPERFRFLDVSREPGDGDPGHSSISVLRGPAV